MRISYTSLETYLQCPKKYYFQDIEKIKKPKTSAQVFGTAIHEALRFMFSLDPLYPTLDEVVGRAHETIEKTGAIEDNEKSRYLDEASRIIKDFYSHNPPWNFQVVDLESRFEVALDDTVYNQHHILVGKIDRIDKIKDGSFEIIDYKTNRRLPAQKDVDNNVQLAIYQLGLQKRWPHIDPKNITLSLFFVKSGEKFSTKRSKIELQETETKILSNLHEIEKKAKNNDFTPRPSPLCEFCPYKPICPAWSHLYRAPEEKIVIEPILEEFFEIKKDIEKKEKRLRELSGFIREYLEKEEIDRVFGARGSISLSSHERTSWDADKIKKFLATSPLLEELKVVDPKKLKLIFARLPYELQEKLKNEARLVKKVSMLKVSTKLS